MLLQVKELGAWGLSVWWSRVCVCVCACFYPLASMLQRSNVAKALINTL